MSLFSFKPPQRCWNRPLHSSAIYKTYIAREEEFGWHRPEPFLQTHSFHLLWVVVHFIHAFQKSSSLFCYPGNLKGNCDSHGESSSVVQKSEVLFVSKAPDCHILLIWMECKVLIIKTGEDTFCLFFPSSHYGEVAKNSRKEGIKLSRSPFKILKLWAFD